MFISNNGLINRKYTIQKKKKSLTIRGENGLCEKRKRKWAIVGRVYINHFSQDPKISGICSIPLSYSGDRVGTPRFNITRYRKQNERWESKDARILRFHIPLRAMQHHASPSFRLDKSIRRLRSISLSLSSDNLYRLDHGTFSGRRKEKEHLH